MTSLIERLKLGDGSSPDHALLLEASQRIAELEEVLEREKARVALNAQSVDELLKKVAELEAKIAMFRAVLLDSAKDVIAWCDKNPPAGDALYCISRLRHAIATIDAAMKEGS